MAHEIVKCKHCSAVVSQCRCPKTADHIVRLVTCASCEGKFPSEVSAIVVVEHSLARRVHAAEVFLRALGNDVWRQPLGGQILLNGKPVTVDEVFEAARQARQALDEALAIYDREVGL